MAPAVGRKVAELRASGQLRLAAAADVGSIDAVVDATGPRGTVAGGWSPVLDRLLHDGSLHAEPLGIGLDVTATGAARDAPGRASDVLSVIGPSRRGSQWETTAVPEIRQQAVVIADRIA